VLDAGGKRRRATDRNNPRQDVGTKTGFQEEIRVDKNQATNSLRERKLPCTKKGKVPREKKDTPRHRSLGDEVKRERTANQEKKSQKNREPRKGNRTQNPGKKKTAKKGQSWKGLMREKINISSWRKKYNKVSKGRPFGGNSGGGPTGASTPDRVFFWGIVGEKTSLRGRNPSREFSGRRRRKKRKETQGKPYSAGGLGSGRNRMARIGLRGKKIWSKYQGRETKKGGKT